MLDQNALSELVQQEIKKEVDQVVKQTNWADQIEHHIISHVQDRITARFSNISTVPDLVATVEASVAKLFENGFVPDVSSFVNTKKLQKSVDLSVENLVTQTLDNLTADPAWIQKIQSLVDRSMVDKLSSALRDIDLSNELKKIVLENQSLLLEHLVKNFESSGIKDASDNTQLTVMNDAVVVEKEFYSNNLSVESRSKFKGDVTIHGDLALLGKVNVDNASWNELKEHIHKKVYKQLEQNFSTSLVEKVLQLSKDGIEFDNITIGGEKLVNKGKLSEGIKKLGTLDNLSIKDTMKVENRRVGINTENPDHALSVWEEEVRLSLGKYSEKTGYIGTSRRQDLILGVNDEPRIRLEKDGGVWVDKLTINKNSISHQRSVPNYAGTKGDIVFNIDYKQDEPFAWICLGTYKWQPLKAR